MSNATSANDTIRQGHCLCKNVRFQVKGDPFHFVVCHCNNCQKSSGGGFMMNTFFKEENFELKAGQDSIKAYQDPITATGKPLTRHFCSNCGSNLFFRMSPEYPNDDVYIVHAPEIEGSEVWIPRNQLFPENRRSFIKHIEVKPKEKHKSKL